MTLSDRQHMKRACELAARGEGKVEPNPMVGCVIALGDVVLAEGWHREYGGPHAEVNAIRELQGRADFRTIPAHQLTLYVTLEPCCHHGKTPPCTEAILASGIRRVVVATKDPFPQVHGEGLQALRQAGIAVDFGVEEPLAIQLLAPYLKRVRTGIPWVIAKWAMTLDGKLAARDKSSQWISSDASRRRVHQLRGRVDAVMIGIGTALADDPLLTPRPPGSRTPLRIIVDSTARLPVAGQLASTAKAAPVLCAVGPNAPRENISQLTEAGVQVHCYPEEDPAERLRQLLADLGKRNITNLLVEGGGKLLGALFDLKAIDEVHAFVAPKLVGGTQSPSPLGGVGQAPMSTAIRLHHTQVEIVDSDVYIRGRLHALDATL